MKNTLVNVCTALALTALAVSTQADTATSTTARVGEAAPGFTLTDANDKTHSLSDFAGKYVVLEWVNYGCPFVKKHYNSGNMQKLQAYAAEKEVVWLTICSSAPEKQGYFEGEHLLEEIKAHESKAAAYLIDADGTVGQLYEAKTTPNMYIIDPKGVLIYAGAIDDKPTVDPADIPSSVNYVTATLEAAMAGKEVAVKATQPYGCSVKYDKK
jgi:peroxiredoxin